MIDWPFVVGELQTEKDCILYETPFCKGSRIQVAFPKGIREDGIGRKGPWSAGAEEGYTSEFIQDRAFYVLDLQTGLDLFP